MSPHTRLALLAAALTFSGCAAIGPRTIAETRTSYNVAVARTNDQELLLNLVRLRYRDSLHFTQVERIAASVEVERGVEASVGLASGGQRSLGLGSAMALREKPTVFYVPVEGERFVRQMLTPIDPELLMLLIRSGGALDRVFQVCVEEVNGLKNLPYDGPLDDRGSRLGFGSFREAVALLRTLQRDRLLDVARTQGATTLELRLAPHALQLPEVARLRTLLGLDPALDRYRLLIGGDAPGDDSIAVSTRPMLAALTYLAHGVTVPESDLAAGRAGRSANGAGAWRTALDQVFAVGSSTTAPADAAVSVQYRGAHFWIADDDLESKRTFVLLTQLIALLSSPNGPGPALSFSFGR